MLLDLGSANYGLESEDVDYRQNVAEDPHGAKVHRCLFANVDHLIDTHPKATCFTIYLNDIDAKGLERAAVNLAGHLKETYADRDLEIKIMQIAQNMFTLESFPQVDYASFIYPFDNPLQRCYQFQECRQEGSLSEKMVQLFTKIVASSRNGLLVKETNMCCKSQPRMLNRMILPEEGWVCKGLHFTRADGSYSRLNYKLHHLTRRDKTKLKRQRSDRRGHA